MISLNWTHLLQETLKSPQQQLIYHTNIEKCPLCSKVYMGFEETKALYIAGKLPTNAKPCKWGETLYKLYEAELMRKYRQTHSLINQQHEREIIGG